MKALSSKEKKLPQLGKIKTKQKNNHFIFLTFQLYFIFSAEKPLPEPVVTMNENASQKIVVECDPNVVNNEDREEEAAAADEQEEEEDEEEEEDDDEEEEENYLITIKDNSTDEEDDDE